VLLAFALFAAWLAWLAYLALHTTTWKPGE